MADLSRVISWIEGEIRKADDKLAELQNESGLIAGQANACRQRLEEAEKLVLILELARDKIKDNAS